METKQKLTFALAGELVDTPNQAKRILVDAIHHDKHWLIPQAESVLKQLRNATLIAAAALTLAACADGNPDLAALPAADVAVVEVVAPTPTPIPTPAAPTPTPAPVQTPPPAPVAAPAPVPAPAPTPEPITYCPQSSSATAACPASPAPYIPRH